MLQSLILFFEKLFLRSDNRNLTEIRSYLPISNTINCCRCKSTDFSISQVFVSIVLAHMLVLISEDFLKWSRYLSYLIIKAFNNMSISYNILILI